MIDPNKPIEALMRNGEWRDCQIVGRNLALYKDCGRGDQVFGFDSQGTVLPAPDYMPVRVRNKRRTVYVNFYADGSCFYYDEASIAEHACNVGGTPELMAAAVPVDLPL